MASIAEALDRYRPLVDDWTAFMDAVHRPLPDCAWVRDDRGDLGPALEDDGLHGHPIDWIEGGLRLGVAPDLAGSLAYRAGLFHVMEEVSMLPAALLGPRPGERILDLCAAPGNKTVLLSLFMKGSGTLVANDPSRARQAVTRTAIHRMGLANVSLTTRSGADDGWAGTGFDRVLVDAPCSCEGTVRKHPSSACRTGEAARRSLADLQRKLLSRAVDACRPGGRIVYATCTFAPEENEAVVSDVLRARNGDCRLLPLEIRALPHSPGVTRWAGTSFHPDLRHAIRVWPHHGDTGGFFCAVLERTGSGRGRARPANEHVERPAAVVQVVERFGLPTSLVDAHRWFRESDRYVAAVALDHAPDIPFATLSTGVSAIRTTGVVPKLTTQGSIALGFAAERNVVDLDRATALAFTERRETRVHAPDPGHVLVRWQGHPLGLGFAREAGGDTALESLHPRTWAGLNRPLS